MLDRHRGAMCTRVDQDLDSYTSIKKCVECQLVGRGLSSAYFAFRVTVD